MQKDERTPPNARELHAIEYIAGLDANLVLAQDVLKERLKMVPNGWRDYRLAMKTVERVVDGIYATMPDKTRRHMMRLSDCGEVVIRPRRFTKCPDDVQIVMDDDIKLLINTVISNECAMCLKDAAKQKKCKLRRVLENIAPTAEVHKNGLCAYVDVARDNEYGEYI